MRSPRRPSAPTSPAPSAASRPRTPPAERSPSQRGRIAGLYNPDEVRAMEFRRITVDPRQMGGIPCLRRLRIPVATVVGMVADGMSEEDILRAYPDLERGDIQEALRYAAAAVQEREIPLVPGP